METPDVNKRVNRNLLIGLNELRDDEKFCDIAEQLDGITDRIISWAYISCDTEDSSAETVLAALILIRKLQHFFNRLALLEEFATKGNPENKNTNN